MSQLASGGASLPRPGPHIVPASQPLRPALGKPLRPASPRAQPAEPRATRHLLWRARQDAKLIVALWLTPTADGCDLTSDVYPLKSLRVDRLHAGPYRFRRAEDAQAFAQEAARARARHASRLRDRRGRTFGRARLAGALAGGAHHVTSWFASAAGALRGDRPRRSSLGAESVRSGTATRRLTPC